MNLVNLLANKRLDCLHFIYNSYCLIIVSLITPLFADDQILFRSGDLNTYRITDGNVETFLESTVFVS